MATISSVEDAIVEALAEALSTTPATVTTSSSTVYSATNPYQPETTFTSVATVLVNNNGTNVPTNVVCRLFKGFPLPNSLKYDIAQGITEVSVFPTQGMYRLLNKYLFNQYISSVVPITFTATVQGLNQVVFGGTCTAGQITGIATGASIIEQAYCYRMTNNDTPASIAAYLGSLIPGATVSGSTVTVPEVHYIQARVASDSTMNQEVAWQAQQFDIHVWSPNPQSRDAVGAYITQTMATTQQLVFEDGSESDITFMRGVWTDDIDADTGAWHAYYRWEIQYPTVIQTIVPGVLFLGVDLNSVQLVGQFDYRDFS